MKRLLFLIPAVLLISATNVAVAGGMNVNITQIVYTATGAFGGCKVRVNPLDAIATQAGFGSGTSNGQCVEGYISMDCDSNWITRSQSSNQVTAAQISLITNTKVWIVVDETKKNNGYCLAKRIDNGLN